MEKFMNAHRENLIRMEREYWNDLFTTVNQQHLEVEECYMKYTKEIEQISLEAYQAECGALIETFKSELALPLPETQAQDFLTLFKNDIQEPLPEEQTQHFLNSLTLFFSNWMSNVGRTGEILQLLQQEELDNLRAKHLQVETKIICDAPNSILHDVCAGNSKYASLLTEKIV
eukprot:TRINITY_DN635_c0_g4_i1.p1 TRINITY_DN635_c0_g4~~TRINITY_DN635_c0_g4_i1.p1  ORF type:complete len:173 (+),score=39.35 TRINITY_DN635_c0_g4_i1:146-664(+)